MMPFMPIDPVQKRLWLREFRLNGFLVLRKFLPVELVQRMHEELTPLLTAEHEKAAEDGYTKGRSRGRLSLHIGPYADLMRGGQECADKIRGIYGEVGGFGTLLTVTQDPDNHEWQHECLELLKNDVGPRIADLG